MQKLMQRYGDKRVLFAESMLKTNLVNKVQNRVLVRRRIMRVTHSVMVSTLYTPVIHLYLPHMHLCAPIIHVFTPYIHHIYT